MRVDWIPKGQPTGTLTIKPKVKLIIGLGPFKGKGGGGIHPSPTGFLSFTRKTADPI